MNDLLADLPAPLRDRVAQVIQSEARLEKENQLLREQLRLLRIEKYGAKSEKLTDAQFSFLELEPGVSRAEVAQEAECTEEEKQAIKEVLVATETRKTKPEKPHRGRVALPAHLPRREVIISCAPQDCCCAQCGRDKTVIGFEESEELDYQPAVAFVRVTKREKRACKHCEEQGVKTAPVPAKIIQKSKLSNGLIVELVIWKYVEHLPLYRIAARFQREYGIELSQSLLCDSVMAVGDLFRGIVGAMRSELLQGSYIQADETTVAVQTAEKSGKNHQGYLWQYSCPGRNVLFDFQMGRSREGPRKMLGEFGGILQSDGYSAYDKIGGRGLRFAACWAHIRRGFVDAVKAAGKEPEALAIVARINALYRVEREAREKKLSAEDRQKLRQEKSQPLMAPLKEAILAAQKSATPKSTLGKACLYALNQWDRAQVYLAHGEVEIDQNLCENAIRPVAIGRKNWLHIGSETAGPRIAAILSIVETCRRLEIDLHKYLLEILPGLSERSASVLKTVTPAAWKASQATR